MIGTATADLNVTSSGTRPKPWVPGDWNGFFGLFTNVLLNVIVLSGLELRRR